MALPIAYSHNILTTVKLVYNDSGLNEIDCITNKLKNLSDNSVILCQKNSNYNE